MRKAHSAQAPFICRAGKPSSSSCNVGRCQDPRQSESRKLCLQAGQVGQAAAAAVLDTLNTSIGLLSFFEALGALKDAMQQAQQKQAKAGAMPASPRASGKQHKTSMRSIVQSSSVTQGQARSGVVIELPLARQGYTSVYCAR